MTMRTLLLFPLLAACASMPADTDRANRELAAILKDRTAGKPDDCLDSARFNGPQIIDRQTLVYRESARRVWVNRLDAACPGLRDGAILTVEMTGLGMCRNDRIRANQPNDIVPGPTCRLGSFTPYDRVAR